METVRTNFRLPVDLLENVERIAGKRQRNRFVEDAIREHVRRVTRSEALTRSAGVLSDAGYPEWQTPQDVAEWVNELRAQDTQIADGTSGDHS